MAPVGGDSLGPSDDFQLLCIIKTRFKEINILGRSQDQTARALMEAYHIRKAKTVSAIPPLSCLNQR